MEAQGITFREAAERCGMHVDTFGRLVQQRGLRVYRTPGGHRRVVVADLNRYLAGELPAKGMSAARVAAAELRAVMRREAMTVNAG